MDFYGNKAAVALFVEDLLQTFGFDFQSITITRAVRYEDCYVSIAIDTSLVVTVVEAATNYSLMPIDTSMLPIQVG